MFSMSSRTRAGVVWHTLVWYGICWCNVEWPCVLARCCSVMILIYPILSVLCHSTLCSTLLCPKLLQSSSTFLLCTTSCVILHWFLCISPEGWAQSGLFLRACVPLLGEAQNLWFRTILSEISENHLCILQHLAPDAFKTHHKINTFFIKCSKHTIKWLVEIVNFNTSQLKS